jgi:uncharacterized protein YebE (UPF0316 family)
MSKVIQSVQEAPVLMVAYAGGFAAGNAVGITLERRIAVGASVILMISRQRGKEIANKLRATGQKLTTIQGAGRDGSRTLLYVTAARRHFDKIIDTAKEVDPNLFFVVDHCSKTSYPTRLHQTSLGWRSFIKRK